MDDFRVKKAGEILSKFFDEKTLRAATQFESFSISWKNIVGQRLADHSKPKSILRQTLLISTDHTGWIQLLQIEEERILQRIAKNFPELKITSLAFTVDEVVSKEKQSLSLHTQQPEAPPSSQTEPEVSQERKMPITALPEPLKEIFARLKHPKGN